MARLDRTLASRAVWDLAQVLELPNPGLSSGGVENLAPGTWYFAVTSYNSNNVESERSNVTSRTIV